SRKRRWWRPSDVWRTPRYDLPLLAGMLNSPARRTLFALSAAAWALVVLFHYYRIHSPHLASTPDVWTGFFGAPRALGAHAMEMVIAGWVLALAWLIGRMLLRAACLALPQRLDDALLSAGLGLGALSALGFAMAACHLGSPANLRAAMVGMTILGIGSAARSYRRESTRLGPWPWGLGDSALAAVLTAFLVVCLFHALAPEISYDALVYHLALPRLWQLSGGFVRTPYLCFSGVPLNLELLYGWPLAWSDEIACKLLDFGLGVMLVASLYALARRLSSGRAGLTAALLMTIPPMMALEFIRTAVDVGAALFGLLCGYAAVVALEIDRRSQRWWVVAGLLCGLAMGSKYTSWPLWPAGVVAIVAAGPTPRRRKMQAALIFSAAALLMILPMIIKDVVYFGDPVYPFFARFFPASHAPLHWNLLRNEAARPLSSNGDLLRYVLDPWRATMGTSTGGNYLGPAFLLLLPGLFFLRAKPAVRFLAWMLAVQWIGLTLPSYMPRFWIPALVYLALFLGLAVDALPSTLVRDGALILVATVSALNTDWTHRYLLTIDGWPAITGQESREAYLSRNHPTYGHPYYPAAEFINAHAPASTRVLIVGDARAYYVNRPYLSASLFDAQPLFTWANESADAGALYERVLDEGVNAILLNAAEAARLGPLWENQLTAHGREVLNQFWRTRLVMNLQDESNNREDPRSLFVYRVTSPGEPPPENAAPNPLLMLLDGRKS
ncbi:MAG TPA: glycosyltransferase family 39 protein, partial [Elusimicrobiota bacterium]|nr:glycosyltransferase family 39 protein [Elusimicrobiota bacterium]